MSTSFNPLMRTNQGSREILQTPGVTIVKEGGRPVEIIRPDGHTIRIPQILESHQPYRLNDGSRQVTYTPGVTITREGDQVKQIVIPGGKVINISKQ